MPADKFSSPTVLQLPKVPRRAKFCQLAQYYPDTLAVIMAATKINDGTEGPKGEPMVRDMDAAERRAAATLTAMQFFVAVMRVRAKFEMIGTNPRLDGLVAFADAALGRCVQYSADRLNNYPISVDVGGTAVLKDTEMAYVDCIFAALRVELQSGTLEDEGRFWRDVFLGFGDADKYGVVGAAARMILLDHMDAFEAALASDVDAADSVTRH